MNRKRGGIFTTPERFMGSDRLSSYTATNETAPSQGFFNGWTPRGGPPRPGPRKLKMDHTVSRNPSSNISQGNAFLKKISCKNSQGLSCQCLEPTKEQEKFAFHIFILVVRDFLGGFIFLCCKAPGIVRLIILYDNYCCFLFYFCTFFLWMLILLCHCIMADVLLC